MIVEEEQVNFEKKKFWKPEQFQKILKFKTIFYKKQASWYNFDIGVETGHIHPFQRTINHINTTPSWLDLLPK